MVTTLRDGGSGIRIPAEERDFFFLKTSRLALGPTTSYSVGTWGSLPWTERPGRELDYSLPCRAQVKNEWSCTSAPDICIYTFMSSFFTLTRDDYFFQAMLLYIFSDMQLDSLLSHNFAHSPCCY
jgi:hypothetical protein